MLTASTLGYHLEYNAADRFEEGEIAWMACYLGGPFNHLVQIISDAEGLISFKHLADGAFHTHIRQCFRKMFQEQAKLLLLTAV